MQLCVIIFFGGANPPNFWWKDDRMRANIQKAASLDDLRTLECFIFDIDGTLLVPDWNYETEYFSSVLNSFDFDIFFPQIADLLVQYEKNFPKYDIDNLSQFLTDKSGVVITPDIINGWNKAVKYSYGWAKED